MLGKPPIYKWLPHIGRYFEILRLTVDFIFIIKFRDFVRVYHIVEIIRLYISAINYLWALLTWVVPHSLQLLGQLEDTEWRDTVQLYKDEVTKK